MIRCTRTRKRIQELLDARVDPRGDNAIAEHADRCPLCAKMLSDLCALRCLADRAATAPMPESGGAEVRARVRAALAEGRQRPVAWRAQAAWSAAALAFLVLGIHAGGRFVSGAAPTPAPAVVSSPAPQVALEPPAPTLDKPEPVVASAPEPSLVSSQPRPVARAGSSRRAYASRPTAPPRDVDVLPVRGGGGTAALVSQAPPSMPEPDRENAPIVVVMPGQGL